MATSGVLPEIGLRSRSAPRPATMVVTRRTDGKPAGKRATVVDDDATDAASTGLTDEAMQQRIDELIAAMTVEEKAGQLTQYFYFGFQRDAEPHQADGSQQR